MYCIYFFLKVYTASYVHIEKYKIPLYWFTDTSLKLKDNVKLYFEVLWILQYKFTSA